MELREALEGAFKQAEDSTTDSTPAPAPEATATTPAPTADVPAKESAPSLPAEGRDEKGRFKPKAEAKPAETAATPPPSPGAESKTETPKPAETTPTPRPPSSWKPAAREKWGALPPEVQSEVVRLEHEARRTAGEAKEAAHLATAFNETVRPYLPLIQAEGGEPLKAIGSLLQTAAALRTAPPAHKARLVADMVRTFGVPIDALDAALAGEVPQAQAQQPYKDPRVDALLAQMQASQASQAEATRAKAAAEVEAAAQELEFLEDVRQDVADLMELAAKRGVALSLKDAYGRAVAMNPELAGVLKQREASRAAAAANAATAKAKAASSSVRSTPASVSADNGPGDSIRAHLEAAFAARSAR